MVGAPDDHLDTTELMKRIDPKSYERYMSIWTEAMKKKDDSLMMDSFRFFLNWVKWAYKVKQPEINEIKDEYISWKKNMQETEVKKIYDSNLKDMGSFTESIIMQNKTINESYLIKNLKEFGEILQGKDKKK